MPPRKKKLLFIIFVLIMMNTPILFYGIYKGSPKDDLEAGAKAFVAVIGGPLFILILGTIATLIIRATHTKNKYQKAIAGYVVPAVLILIVIAR